MVSLIQEGWPDARDSSPLKTQSETDLAVENLDSFFIMKLKCNVCYTATYLNRLRKLENLVNMDVYSNPLLTL